MDKNLRPRDLSKRSDHKELSAKGGRSKSPSKVFASRLNGMLQKKDLDPEQRWILAKLKDKQFADVVIELIAMNLDEIEDSSRRDKVIDQLMKFLPSQSVVMEVDSGKFCQKCGGEFITADMLADAWEEEKSRG